MPMANIREVLVTVMPFVLIRTVLCNEENESRYKP